MKYSQLTTTTRRSLATTSLALVALLTLTGSHQLDCARLVNGTASAAVTITSPDQSESLKMSLNESLTRFLAANIVRQHRNQQQPTQQQQQQVIVNNNSANQQQLKKISCDELSLVVLAQRMLNMSSSSGAISRLIECKQENLLDSKHMEILAGNERLSQAEQQISSLTGAASEPTADAQTTRREQFQLQLTMDNERLTTSTPQASTSGVHFGAKMAISSLVAIILLVVIATLVDYQQTNQDHPHHEEASRKKSSSNRRGGEALFSKRRDSSSKTIGLRDYRSLSLSSNCSSSNNHFCSTNSVASSSAPILSGNLAPCQLKCSSSSSSSSSSTSSSPQPMASGCTIKSDNHHYESNLQMHFCANQQHEQQCCFRPLTINMPHGSTNSPPAYCLSPPTSYTDSYASQVMSSEQANQSRPLGVKILLAFSLRQSASQIFDTMIEGRRRTQSMVEDEKEKEKGVKWEPKSVDSLHGLRFLSMIWVIIIHSYNFALRWMFFSNTTTLDGIYKSAASQLIANGSFACDSFFFAGGFLLPYLAFSESTPVSDQQEQTAAAAAPAMSKESTSVCACQLFSALVYAREQQQVRPSALSTCESCGLASGSPQVAILVSGATSAGVQELNTNEDDCSGQQSSAERQPEQRLGGSQFTMGRVMGNICHRYVRMMPLMMAIIGLCSTLMRYLGDGPIWQDSTLMYDGWCRKNWWINAMFLHNFLNRENMCLSHSWYSAVDLQLFLVGQLILYVLARSRRFGLALLGVSIGLSQMITIWLTLAHHLPAVPLVSSVNEQTMNLYYGEIYIKPYCRAAPYLIGILLAYLMRTTKLGQLKLSRWQILTGWSLALSAFVAIILAMQPAMNGHTLSPLESALYSALSRPLWALATGWMIYACITQQAGLIGRVLEAKCFIPLSRLTYPAFLIHPIVMALFYGSRQASFHFSHYLMLYLILGNIVITYACAFILAALFELPLLSIERTLNRKRAL